MPRRIRYKGDAFSCRPRDGRAQALLDGLSTSLPTSLTSAGDGERERSGISDEGCPTSRKLTLIEVLWRFRLVASAVVPESTASAAAVAPPLELR